MTDSKLPVRVLTARESEDYARRGAFGPDSAYLAQLLRNRGFGRGRSRTIMVAALDADGSPACWAAFTADARDAGLWHYGNLYTRPERRRLGLAQAVVSTGLEVTRAARAHILACLVGEANPQSRSLHERLGFVETPLRKSILSVTPSVTPLCEAEFADYRVSARTLEERLAQELSSWRDQQTQTMLAVALDRLAVERPLLPWRRPAARMGIMVLESGATMYIRRGESLVCAMLGRQHAGSDRQVPCIELMSRLQSPGQPKCALFHHQEFTAALAPHSPETFVVTAFRTTPADSGDR